MRKTKENLRLRERKKTQPRKDTLKLQPWSLHTEKWAPVRLTSTDSRQVEGHSGVPGHPPGSSNLASLHRVGSEWSLWPGPPSHCLIRPTPAGQDSGHAPFPQWASPQLFMVSLLRRKSWPHFCRECHTAPHCFRMQPVLHLFLGKWLMNML